MKLINLIFCLVFAASLISCRAETSEEFQTKLESFEDATKIIEEELSGVVNKIEQDETGKDLSKRDDDDELPLGNLLENEIKLTELATKMKQAESILYKEEGND